MRQALIAILLLGLSALARADDLPTLDSLQQLKAQQKWPELLRGATRLLQLRGKPAEGIDRAAVWMLKAEAQLQSHQFVPAAESFENAADESVEPSQADWALAMSMICRQSDANGYRPRATRRDPSPKAHPIGDESKRKQAVEAMLDAELRATEGDLSATTVAPRDTERALERATKLRRVERAVSSSTERADALISKGTDGFAGGIDAWCKSTLDEIDKMEQAAAEEVRDDQGRLRPRGLSEGDRKRLKAMLALCRVYADAWQTISRTTGDLAGDVFKALPPRLEQVYTRAGELAKPRPVRVEP